MKRLVFVLPSLWIWAACGETDTPAPATTPDASTLDATTDVGAKPDTGTTVTDSGPKDTGQPDTAQPTDSGPTDAGPVDSGGIDCSGFGVNDTVSATIKVTADDYLDLWVNGTQVDHKVTTWGTVDTVNVSLFRYPGRANVIALAAYNAFNQGGFDRGALLDLGIDTPDGGIDAGRVEIVSDSTWKVLGDASDAGVIDASLLDAGADAGPPGWTAVNFDDATWGAAFVNGPHGMSPWGTVFGTSNAQWLWSYDSSTNGSKPSSETVLLRKTFYLDLNGQPQAVPTACK